jgi:hypothetical protein
VRRKPDTFPQLHSALSPRIKEFAVEFHFMEGERPHPLFKFNFDNQTIAPFASVRLSIEQKQRGDFGGESNAKTRIELCPDRGPTAKARAAFRFPIQRAFTLRDSLEVIGVAMTSCRLTLILI